MGVIKSDGNVDSLFPIPLGLPIPVSFLVTFGK